MVLALCAGWWIRFDSLNAYCREQFGTVTQEYQIGETVEYGDDFVSSELQHKNCSITASSAEFLSLTDFLRKYDCELWSGAEQVSDVIADITILISNASDEDLKMFFFELPLHGYSFQTYCDAELMNVSNPWLDASSGKNGFAVRPGETGVVHLAYRIFRTYMDGSVWNLAAPEPLWIHLTDFPTEKEIRIR